MLELTVLQSGETKPMMRSLLVVALALGASYCAAAETYESCPMPADIKIARGVYTATTNDNEGEWIGTSRGPGDGNIKEFTSAMFFPPQLDNDGSVRSPLVRCSYELAQGGHLDLRFDPRPPVPGLRVDVGLWRRKSGPYDLDYYECTERAAWRCRFEVVRRP
ncbi:DUF3757 domain-containing protein [Paraburkholderia sp. BR14320]|uniref:DUF3757 domain-containing protein n=1 Tax=unclassified Paraburkholderia TaxID=2615204 RepID=UPI0034CDDC74